MPRQKKAGGYEKTTINMRQDLKKSIYANLPHDGATDLGAFIELATERELAALKSKRKPK